MRRLLSKIFGPKKQASNDAAPVKPRAAGGDPLDLTARAQGWEGQPAINPVQRTIKDFPLAEVQVAKAATDQKFKMAVADGTDIGENEMDAPVGLKGQFSAYTVPEQLQGWYLSQSFIGYQACAIIAQNWLVDKACSMAGEDAIRNGWEIKALGDSGELSKAQLDELRSFDTKFKLKANLAEMERFKNIFGIRVAIFHVESDDKDYYEKPFNIDGVTEGSYKGISQIDPYWMMPMLTAESTADPSNIHFYDPEFWVISGKKYHRSHLIISRGPQPADILKPTYIFGGIPLTQRIYERVYAAERTANEAPLLALNKRTTAIHVDVEKALMNEKSFVQKLLFWVKYRDNYAVKVLGKEETMEQFDTNLSDFDSVIMNQYQLVAAIAKIPSTKILGTSPKGFNATGEFETVSYHEELESIQEHGMHPMAQRHYEILAKSLGIEAKVEVVFEPVDSVTEAQQAEINEKKSNTNKNNVEMGAISPDEVRDSLRDDKRSGYNRLTDEAAEEKPGMSPENLAEFEKAGAAEEKARAEAAGAGGLPGAVPEVDQEPTHPNTAAVTPVPGQSPAPSPSADPTMSLLLQLTAKMEQIEAALTPEGVDLPKGSEFSGQRTSRPSVSGVQPTVAGVGSVLSPNDGARLPKLKFQGLMITIENPRGTIRRGTTLDGEEWKSKMPHHYGFIRGVTGADGDELDCFVGPNPAAPFAYVVNQKEPTNGEFDEHKVMLGFDSPEEAKDAYLAAYQAGWDGYDGMISIPMDEFKHRLKDQLWNRPAEAGYIPKHKEDK